MNAGQRHPAFRYAARRAAHVTPANGRKRSPSAGAAGLWLSHRFLANGFRIWAAVVVIVAVVSVAAPLGFDIDTGSKVALALMHVATGATAIIGQALVRTKSHEGAPPDERQAGPERLDHREFCANRGTALKCPDAGVNP